MIAGVYKFRDTVQGVNPELWLPPAWQLIYQEAIVGNHELLFAKKDLARFGEDDLNTPSSPTILKEAEELGVKLFAASSIPEMRALISGVDYPTRTSLYLIYRGLIANWSNHLRRTLN